MRLAIYGAGGYGREVLGFTRRLRGDATATEETVFVSDVPAEIGRVADGTRIVSFQDVLQFPNREIAIAIADRGARRAIAERCAQNAIPIRPVLAAPTHVSYQDPKNLGEGAIFGDFTMVTALGVRIGKHFHCNIYSYVAHDCVIGDYVTFAPKVCCNGHVRIEDDVYVGAGAVIKQSSEEHPIVIGKGAVVGMGAIVTKSVPPGAIVVGNPAAPLAKR